MFERILHITLKEFIELWRDKWGRFRLIVPPILQMLIFGYAATFEIFNVPMAVLDFDHSQESRELVSRFTFSPYFHLERIEGRDNAIAGTIDRDDVPLAVVIHAGFAKSLAKGESTPVEVVVDGTNSNTALVALGYVGSIASQFSVDYAQSAMGRSASPVRPMTVSLEPRPWFNPDLSSRWFFVPGVIGTITLVMVVNLCAFAVVREREMGTLEQIMVTPIRSSEFILGKTLPFFLVGLGIAGLVAGSGIVWFHVPFTGNPLVLLLGTALFLLCALSLGLFIHHLPESAAGFCVQLLRPQSPVHSIWLRLSHFEHADGAAMDHLARSAALLSRRNPRDLLEGGWDRRPLAGDDKHGGLGRGSPNPQHPALP